MRILAIRGENLASLAAPFELRFDASPIESSRIFAIVGSTGAGKSTILDALCLALFHRTPRLGAMAGGTDVSDGAGERIKSYDPRALLHRGATSAFAECEFEGQDHGRYRARWSVRRAKSGRLQPAKPELFHLESGVAIGRTKGEVSAEIGERLGLDFEQFRRSVLLAQGDFAAFLRATPTERGELLASMTSTTVYGELSRAAHGRARDEHIKLRERRASAERLAPLKAIDRQKLDARTEALDAKRSELAQALSGRRKRVDIFARDEVLQRAVDATAVAVATERQRARDIGPRRKALLNVRSADRFRDVIRALEERRVAFAKTKDQVSAAQRALSERERQAVELRQRSESHRERRRRFDAEAARFEAAHERAAGLDAAIRAAEAGVRRCEEERVLARSKRDTLDATQSGRRKTMARLEAEEAVDDAWLKERPYRADGHVDVAIEKLHAHAALVDRLRSLEAEEQGTRRALLFLQADTGALDAELTRAKREWADADSAMRAGEAASVAPRQARVERLQDALVARDALVKGAARSRVARDSAEAAARACAATRATQEATNTELARASAALEDARSNFALHDSALADAERQRDAHRLAEHLSGDAPCPVCGSQEHPSPALPLETDNTPALRQAKERAAALVQRLTGTHSDIRERRGAVNSQAELGAERSAAASSAYAAVRAEEDTLAEAYRDALLATDSTLSAEVIPELVARARSSQDSADALKADALDAADALDEANAHARKELVTALAASAKAQTNHERRDRANTSREFAERALERGAEREREATAKLRVLAEQRQSAERALRQLEQALEALAGAQWRDPAFSESLESDARTLSALRETFDERRMKLVGLRAHASDARARELELAELVSTSEKALETARCELDDLKSARSQLLGGLSIQDARAKRSLQDVELRESAETHRSFLAEAERLGSAGRASLESLRDELTRRQSALQETQDELQDRLAEARVDEAFVREHLASAIDREHEEHALRKIDEALSVAGARHDHARKEQRVHREAHAEIFGEPEAVPLQGDLFSAQVPELPAVDIAALRAQESSELKIAEADHESLERQLIDARAAQQRDDEALRSTATLDDDLKSLEAGTRVWGELAELIGSSDGKKFQLFAQGLTLDILLGHANVQLSRLFPRYELERTPGSDLSIQVSDQDMGGTIRSVDTLSGGETFIVSLALALALAGLSARQTPLQTLFIDEGFGSLDAASLETVLDVLDAVQAQGKQIGIISHVDEIAERFRVRVNVEREGEGRSVVTVHPAPGPSELLASNRVATPEPPANLEPL